MLELAVHANNTPVVTYWLAEFNSKDNHAIKEHKINALKMAEAMSEREIIAFILKSGLGCRTEKSLKKNISRSSLQPTRNPWNSLDSLKKCVTRLDFVPSRQAGHLHRFFRIGQA